MAPLSIVFTGNDKVEVRAFISWMESWYATQGEEYADTTLQAKRLRVVQIHIACPIKSEAGRFWRQLPEEV